MNEQGRTLRRMVDQLRQAMRHWMQRHERDINSTSWRYVVLAWIGCIGMPGYYLIWTYVFPQEYESLTVRLLGVLLCLPALGARTWLGGRYLDTYIFVAITYALPFQFTYLYLMNHASSVWGQSYLIALIVLFHFPTLWALAACAVGTLFGCLLFAWMGDARFLLDPVVLEHLPVYAFTIVVVSAAKVGRRMLANEKLAGMAHGLAAVSHELRTPLISVDANVRGINRRLGKGAPGPADCEELLQAVGRIQHEVRHMNHMVDMFLLSASAVSQKLEASEQVSMHDAVEAVIRRYPFVGQAQRDAVQVRMRGDFMFAGQQELAVVILLNLLRNALKALHRAGKGRIRIVVDGKRATPRLLFIDTGCGIAAPQLPHIFKRFYSYPPESGSGIGLALCKEIVDAWHARIRCISREQSFTMFILEFPPTGAATLAPPRLFPTIVCPSPSTITPA